MHDLFHGADFERGEGARVRDVKGAGTAGSGGGVCRDGADDRRDGGAAGALPAEQHRRMPPREIVDRTIDKAEEATGERVELDRDDRVAMTTIAHLAFGAAAGALYGAFGPRRPRSSPGSPTGLASGRPPTVSGCRRLASILPHHDDTRIATKS